MKTKVSLMVVAPLLAAAAALVPVPAPARTYLAQDRPGRRAEDRAPKVGDKAPNFKLKTLGDSDKEIQLSDFAGKRAVVLIFGSYT